MSVVIVHRDVEAKSPANGLSYSAAHNGDLAPAMIKRRKINPCEYPFEHLKSGMPSGHVEGRDFTCG
jgi:hypothetical protein